MIVVNTSEVMGTAELDVEKSLVEIDVGSFITT